MTTPAAPVADIVKQVPSFVLPPDFEGKIPGTERPAAPAAPDPQAPAAPAAAPEAKGKEGEQEAEAKPGETPQDETTGKDPDEEQRRKSALDRRTSRAIRRAAEERARREQLEREVTELRTKVSQPAQPAKDDGAPRMEDYTDVQEYAKAYAKWNTDKEIAAREETARKETMRAEETRVLSGWAEQSAKAAEKHEDFDEVVGELKYGVTPWGDAIMLAENGADVAYYLGKNEKEASRIMSLSPKQQFIEVGKLAYKLSVAVEAPKKPSKAPAPIAPVAAPADVRGDGIRPGMSPEEYMKVGNKMFRGK